MLQLMRLIAAVTGRSAPARCHSTRCLLWQFVSCTNYITLKILNIRKCGVSCKSAEMLIKKLPRTWGTAMQGSKNIIIPKILLSEPQIRNPFAAAKN